MGSESASTSLAPGFRFHPTDEELVSYYLKRKICGKPFRFNAIGDIDIYKVEPWDLPALSKLKSRDLEWYFFSGLDRKYGNGSRTNRATCEGYWKTTGKDRAVHHKGRLVGMKKTLVYHLGRAPHGKRSNWVMHEYRLVDETLEKAGYSPDGFVLCRIFQKSGAGPKNGEKYGAPLVEEEWENDNVGATVPGEVSFEDPSVDDDAFIEQNDLTQSLDLQLPGNIPVPFNRYHGDSNVPVNNYSGEGNLYVEDFGGNTGSEEKPLAGETECNSDLKVLDNQQLFDLPIQVGSNGDVVKNEHMARTSNVANDFTTNSLSNETSPDSVGNAAFDDGLFLDAIDFLDPADENAMDFGLLESYLQDDFDVGQYLTFDSHPEMTGSDADQTLSATENLDGASWQLPSANQQLPESSEGSASSSKHVMDVAKSRPSKPDMQYPFLSQASRLLGNIAAPPAYASEMPTKDMAARLTALQSSSSFHVTAGMIRFSDTTATGSRLQWSFDKAGNVNVLFSIDVPEDVSQSGRQAKMAAAAVSRGWSWFMFFWVLFCAVSFKIGSCIYAK